MRQYPACIAFGDRPREEPVILTPTPPYPGHSMAADCLVVPAQHTSGRNIKYLIITCMLTGWSTTFRCNAPLSSANSGSRRRKWFHKNGWPEVFATDGEPLWNYKD